MKFIWVRLCFMMVQGKSIDLTKKKGPVLRRAFCSNLNVYETEELFFGIFSCFAFFK